MKAIGYVRCKTCDGLYRGYAPRHWKRGEELATWQHTLETGWGAKCPGSYKSGYDTHLDTDRHKNQVHPFVGGSIDGAPEYCDTCGKLHTDPVHQLDRP